MNEVRFGRLTKSIEWSKRQLEYPQSERLKAVRQFVGSHHVCGGAKKPVPVPFLSLAVMVFLRRLMPQAPLCMMSTDEEWLRPVAAAHEIAVNKIPNEIDLTQTLRRQVVEAMFSPWGVVKHGLYSAGSVLGHSYGKSFVDLVTFDDYFIDMSAKKIDEIDYEGNDYWVDYEELMDSKDFISGSKDKLKPDERTYIGPAGEQRADSISTNSTAETFKDKIWVRDVWLPDEKVMLTYGITSKSLFREREIDAPIRGPYTKLSFIEVVGEILNLPPVALWRDLHDLANALFRKLGNQADGQKTVLGFDGSDDESVEAFKNASDGAGIKYNGRKPEKLEAGGVNRETLAFQMQCRDLFSYFAGNIDSLGGLAAQTETVGQDRLIAESANSQIKDMADRVIVACKEVYTALAFYEWNDPIKRRKLEKEIPGTGMSIRIDYGPEQKLGRWEDYSVGVDVYSLQDKSPETQLQKLLMVVKEYVFPYAAVIQQNGGVIQIERIYELIAKYANLPELSEIIVFADGVAQQSAEAQGMPQHTTREYVRRGAPGQTKSGASAAMQQILMGGGVQEAENPF